jgi:hypothetical protein
MDMPDEKIIPVLSPSALVPLPTPEGKDVATSASLSDLTLQLENTKLKFEADSRAVLEKHESALRELRAYKWVVRMLFALILGGSIYSFLKIDDYVDEHVAKRFMKTDRLSLLLSQAEVGHWRDALGLLDEIRTEIGSGKLKADQDFKRYLYYDTVWLLGQTIEKNPDGAWVGQEQYDILMKDPDFRRELFTRGNLLADGDLLNLLALCALKYEQTPASLVKARGYLDQALNRIYPSQRKANIHWSLAMLDLLENHLDSAKQHLESAASLNPVEFRITDLVPYKNSFLNAPEFILWSDLAAKTNKPDFRQTFEAFIVGL